MLQNYKSERKYRWLEASASQTTVKDVLYDRYGDKTDDIHKAVSVECKMVVPTTITLDRLTVEPYVGKYWAYYNFARQISIIF